jgi:hypothetical protein
MSGSGFDSTVCIPEQLAISGASEFYCYTRRQNIGLVVCSDLQVQRCAHETIQAVALAGFLSLAAVVTILLLIAVRMPCSS